MERNGPLVSSMLFKGSHTKVWWKCEKGHSWKASMYHRTQIRDKKIGCPFCANQKVLVGFNDILTANPEIDEFWDFDNNDIGIYDCVASSRKKVFWKCYNNHTWIKSISSQINNRCPICKIRPDSGKKH